MTRDEAIEAGAIAIYRLCVRNCRPLMGETEEEAWQRKWSLAMPLTRHRHREEAEAVLRSVGMIR